MAKFKAVVHKYRALGLQATKVSNVETQTCANVFVQLARKAGLEMGVYQVGGLLLGR